MMMTFTFSRLLKQTMAAAALCGAGLASVQAQPMGMMEGHDCPAMPHAQEGKAAQWQERMAKRHEQRQQQLHHALKLTPAQEEHWKNYIEATRPPGKPAQAHDGEGWNQLTTPQRLERMQQFKAERDARMNRHLEAVKQFYSQLTAEQQKVFDQHHRMAPPERPRHP